MLRFFGFACFCGLFLSITPWSTLYLLWILFGRSRSFGSATRGKIARTYPPSFFQWQSKLFGPITLLSHSIFHFIRMSCSFYHPAPCGSRVLHVYPRWLNGVPMASYILGSSGHNTEKLTANHSGVSCWGKTPCSSHVKEPTHLSLFPVAI